MREKSIPPTSSRSSTSRRSLSIQAVSAARASAGTSERSRGILINSYSSCVKEGCSFISSFLFVTCEHWLPASYCRSWRKEGGQRRKVISKDQRAIVLISLIPPLDTIAVNNSEFPFFVGGIVCDQILSRGDKVWRGIEQRRGVNTAFDQNPRVGRVPSPPTLREYLLTMCSSIRLRSV